MERKSLFGMIPDEINEIVSREGLPSYTAGQITRWLYKKDTGSIDDMTDLSKRARNYLMEHYKTGLEEPVSVSESIDGTRKYLFKAGAEKYIEAAWIPEENRGTLCLSTQIGCKMGCEFCMTGKQGFQGNLTAGEILNQLKKLPEKEQLTNIVYMGMGEPLDNLDEVLKSLEILTSPWGFAMSPRRITVSTVGLLPAIKRFLNESDVHLAISLHTPFDEERRKIMPVQKIHPVKEIIREVRKYDWHGQRRISMEYILFKGFNDSDRHVNELSLLLKGLNCRINLIRYHPLPFTRLEGITEKEAESFRDKLNRKNIITTLRKSRGLDIDAACGLLSTKNKFPDSCL